MFNGCSELKKLYINHFKTSNVIDMRFMFGLCSSLNELNISNIDINDKCCIRWMFSNCDEKLKNDVKKQNELIAKFGLEDYS